MLKAKGRYWKIDSKFYIYIPKDLASDSQFPLTRTRGDLDIEILDGSLIVKAKL